MNLIKAYIKNFLNRAGGYIFTATVVARIFSFLTSWIALQLIPNKELGLVLFSWNIITFLIPFIGFGLHQSYIRYGALTNNNKEREFLLNYVLKNGVIASGILSIIIASIGFLFPFKLFKTGYYLSTFSLIFIPLFLFEIIKIKARLEHRNKVVAYSEIIYNSLLIITVSLFCYFFTEKGYVIAFILTPIITVFIFRKEISIQLKPEFKKPFFINKEFWKYGFFGGLANVATMLLFAIDILLVGYLLEKPESVTAYRYISIIPFSILFLPRVFITTDFVSFTEKITQKKYIYNYIKSYMLLFAAISIGFVLFFYLFDETTLTFFDTTFVQHTESFFILNLGVCGILIFRGIFGNLLSSIGKIKANYYITLIALCINIVSNYYLIPKLGIRGAAITSALLMWFTGLTSCFTFFYYYKKNNFIV